jgi:hypothetical protein
VQVDVRFSSKELARDDRLFATVARGLTEMAVLVNRAYLRLNPGTPELFRSGVVYQNEPLGLPDELVDVPTVISRGWGDCMHLCAWRVAELRERGEAANVRFVWNRMVIESQPARLFHVQVRRGNGSIEDPSRILGMK